MIVSILYAQSLKTAWIIHSLWTIVTFRSFMKMNKKLRTKNIRFVWNQKNATHIINLMIIFKFDYMLFTCLFDCNWNPILTNDQSLSMLWNRLQIAVVRFSPFHCGKHRLQGFFLQNCSMATLGCTRFALKPFKLFFSFRSFERSILFLSLAQNVPFSLFRWFKTFNKHKRSCKKIKFEVDRVRHELYATTWI